MDRPEIRDDDILQIGSGSVHQSYRLVSKDLYSWFLEADKAFAKYNYPCTLAILANGIDYWPEWVAHIKKNIYRYKIELHGWNHYYHYKLSEEQLYNSLKKAKDKIEQTFGQKITTWYVPYGFRGHTPLGPKVCEKLGIRYVADPSKIDAKKWLTEYKIQGKMPFPQVNFHYWAEEQIVKVNHLLWRLHQGKN